MGRPRTSGGKQLSSLAAQKASLKDQVCDLILTDVKSGRNTE